MNKFNTFSEQLKVETLPPMLNTVCGIEQDKYERDIMLLATLTACSACIAPNVKGEYDDKMVYANFYTFISAPAGAGKGRMNFARNIVAKIDDEKKQEYYESMATLKDSEMLNGEVAEKTTVPYRTLLIPANISASAMIRQLYDNGGQGLMFETEADTLSDALKKEYANYSDLLRNAFHHECVSLQRRKDNEFVEIKNPCLSVLLSGTVAQIRNLIPNTENGLFSRFAMYRLPMREEWRDVFAKKNYETEKEYNILGNRFYALYDKLRSVTQPIIFSFTDEQCKRFNEFFDNKQSYLYEIFGGDIMASVRRLGLITFRMAMTMSVLRLEGCETLPSKLICTDSDFENTLKITECLIEHMLRIYEEMPDATNGSYNMTKDECGGENLFFERLPSEFDSATMMAVAGELCISKSSVYRYIEKLRKAKKIDKQYGKYKKIQYNEKHTF